MNVTIRADGGPDIGYGHLVRSNALAEEFLRRDHGVAVATTTPKSAQSVFPGTVEIIELPSRSDPEPFVDWLSANSPDAVFTDSYPVDTDYQRAIRDQSPLAVLQDDDRHTVCADVFVNGNLYAADLDYEFVGSEPQLCLGTDYVLLRREIREQASDEPPWREQPEHAIVTMGGSDAKNLTPDIVRAFDGTNLRVDAVVGPGVSTQQEQEIRTASTAVSANIRVTRDPDDLSRRMFEADFGVTTASSTVYELLALGTPIACVPVAANQRPIATALQDQDLATILNSKADVEAFGQAVETYILDSDLRRKRRTRGRMLVDDGGTDRIADAVQSIHS